MYSPNKTDSSGRTESEGLQSGMCLSLRLEDLVLQPYLLEDLRVG